MKKIIIFIFSFAIIAFLITFILIRLTNAQIITNKIDNVINVVTSNTKTMDLYGTFDENDIIIDKKNLNIDGIGYDIEIPQISGLINKTVEKNINSSIEQKVYNLINNCIEKVGNYEITTDNSSASYYNYSNFSNVISFSYDFSFDLFDTSSENYDRIAGVHDTIGLNYSLVDGKEIKLEDMFTKTDDAQDVVRIAFNRWAARLEQDRYDGENEPYYDSETGKWFRKEYQYNEEKDIYEEKIVEFIPQVTEYEINKKIQKFMKDENKIFYFSTNRIYFKTDENNIDNYYYIYSIPLEDIANKIVIYDKYITKTSIFEKDDIGAKGLIVGTTTYGNKNYKQTKYESDNYFYDIDVSGFYNASENPYQEFLDNKINDVYQEGKDIINSYKDKASNDKEHAYFVFIQLEPSVCSYNNSFYSIVSIDLGVKVISCDINEKQKYLDNILSKYRYYNLGFYGGIYGYLYSYENEGQEDYMQIDEQTKRYVYNTITGKEIKSVKELFKPGINYEEILISKVYEKFYYLEEPIDTNSLEYEISVSGIELRDAKQNGGYVDYSDIIEYLALEEKKISVLSSSDTRIINDYELENMSLDELNYAYNEIFARHGHDFKNEDYREYFSKFDWYKPIEGKIVSLDELSDVEIENVKLIKLYIDQREAEENNY